MPTGVNTESTNIYPYYSLTIKKFRFSCKRVRFVRRDPRLRGFNDLFIAICLNAKKVYKNNEHKKFVNVLSLLDQIIPDKYFGNRNNRKKFYCVVKLILTCSIHECVFNNTLIRGVDLYKVPWLRNIMSEKNKTAILLAKRFYFDGQLWLLEKIVKPLIFRFYALVKRGQTYEIDFVPRSVWKSFKTKVSNNLVKKGHIVANFEGKKPRGILRIIPKRSYSDVEAYRPIIMLYKYRNNSQKYIIVKEIIKKLRLVSQNLCQTKTSKLYEHWTEYVKKTKGVDIYGVKIDIKDAFGNVNIDILCECLRNIAIRRLNFVYIENLVERIQNVYVCFCRTKKGVNKTYQWKHGLIQGDKYSSVLCQLYLSYLDSLHLKDFYKETNFIHRTVDDYFFCSSNPCEVKKFFAVMKLIHNINEKTQGNLPEFGNFNEIEYNGQIFILNSKQITGLYRFKKRTEIRHRFRFWDFNKPIIKTKRQDAVVEQFLKRAAKYTSNNFHLQNLELNTVFNSEETVKNNFFKAMIFLAFKFDAAMMCVYDRIRDNMCVKSIVVLTVYKYAHKAVDTTKKFAGEYYSGLLEWKTFVKIGFCAFYLVFKKRKEYKKLRNDIFKLLTSIKSLPVIKPFLVLPESFNDISIQRRLPHHKKF